MQAGASDPDDPQFDRVRFKLRSLGVRPGQLPDNPLRSGIHSRGYLPHVKRAGAWYFVTFRLGDSLPREVLMRFEHERAEQIRSLGLGDAAKNRRLEIERELRRKIERHLDAGNGDCFLRMPAVADLVVQALGHFAGERYLLGDWVVMPNHVHVTVWPQPNHVLSDILKSWKTFTAREANKLLGRTGRTFWQRESYDHWIRSDDERARIQRYIRNNPVKAGLCASPEEWRWSSAFPNGASGKSGEQENP